MPLDSTISSAVHPSPSTPKTPTSDESPSGQPPAWGQGNMFGRGKEEEGSLIILQQLLYLIDVFHFRRISWWYGRFSSRHDAPGGIQTTKVN